jgi:hypothetical protein
MLEEVEGEVLAFDQSTRMLILKGCTYRLLSTLITFSALIF